MQRGDLTKLQLKHCILQIINIPRIYKTAHLHQCPHLELNNS